MVKKIYLDMDGVLCDFEKKFTEYYGFLSLAKRDRKQWSGDWEDFILNKKGFEKLDSFGSSYGNWYIIGCFNDKNKAKEAKSNASGEIS